jgi:ribonucleoside-diphosphate reductase beta chain
VYFLRSKGLLNGLASGTNWVFRDESGHMNFAFAVIEQVREPKSPACSTTDLNARIEEMMREAIECEVKFAEDVLSQGIAGMSVADTREYLQYVADQRLMTLGVGKVFGSKNPFSFMELQDVQELTNFFERTTSSYQVGIEGDVSFDEEF